MSTIPRCRFFFDLVVFLLTSLESGSRFMSMSLLVPKLWKILPRLKFVQYLGTGVSKSYQSRHGCFSWVATDCKMRSLTISELFGENQQGVKLPPSPSPRLKLTNNFHSRKFLLKEQKIYKSFIISKKIQPTNKVKLNKNELSFTK